MCLFYSTLWLIAAILATIYGTQWDMSALKGAAVSTIECMQQYIMGSSLNKSKCSTSTARQVGVGNSNIYIWVTGVSE